MLTESRSFMVHGSEERKGSKSFPNCLDYSVHCLCSRLILKAGGQMGLVCVLFAK